MGEEIRGFRKSPWWKIWKRRSQQKRSSFQRHFPLFSELSDDIQRHILSFVATAPYECIGDSSSRETNGIYLGTATLTKSLPYVSCSFSEFTQSSNLWEECFRRAVRHDPQWQIAVEVVDWEQDVTDYRSLYRKVVQEHIQFTGPVFVMDLATVPRDFDLFLFEDRYRIMMQNLLANHANDGTVRPPMCFLHAYCGLVVGERSQHNKGRRRRRHRRLVAPAKLLQVQRCLVHPNGSYSVTVQVVAHTYIEKSWVVPEAGNLFYAQAVRVRHGV